jgi:hypothetical protein
MTKKDAAVQVWGVASRLRKYMQGDEEIDFEVLFLVGIAKMLDPGNRRYIEDEVKWTMDDGPAVLGKLRNLIEHPDTPVHEREAAVRMLAKLKAR